MNHDAVLRAKVRLFDEDRLGVLQLVHAYRVLVGTGPAAYRPKLSRALVELSEDASLLGLPEARLRLLAEAVAAAEGLAQDDPVRPPVLFDALDAHQRELYGQDRRPDGLAARGRLLAVARTTGRADGRLVRALGGWATALAEEGRAEEAAAAFGELVRVVGSARVPDHPRRDGHGLTPGRVLPALAGQLAAAGRGAEAVAVLAELVGLDRAEAEGEGGPTARLLQSTVRFAGQLSAAGRHGRAAEVRQEALALFAALATRGERRAWTGDGRVHWSALLALSGAAAETAEAGAPGPAFGMPTTAWSPGVRRGYRDGRDALAAEVAALLPQADADPGAHLGPLVALHRRLLVRTAVETEAGGGPLLETLLPGFDRGVALARRLHERSGTGGAAALALALTDRAALLAVCGQYGYALTDYEQAVERTGGPAPEPATPVTAC
ncbi:hypothetical protein AB0D08_39815 [Kitasatospora sp. NPDC048540]|uniref:hypothetical protein n=1 Tax=Kitasatospora sp. NPDC048540 TaxID=3155634 RepID=UPI0033E58D44